MRRELIMSAFVLLTAILLDISLSGKIKVYFTVLCLSFVLVKLKPIPGFYFAITSGILMDILFSTYVGPITIIFILIAGLSLVIHTHYKINDIIFFFTLSISALLLAFIRVRFAGFLQFSLMSILVGFPVYLLLNAVFIKLVRKYERKT